MNGPNIFSVAFFALSMKSLNCLNSNTKTPIWMRDAWPLLCGGCMNTIASMVTNKETQSQKDPEATYQWLFFSSFGPFLRSFRQSGHVICCLRILTNTRTIQYNMWLIACIPFTTHTLLVSFYSDHFFALRFLYRANAHQFMAVNW